METRENAENRIDKGFRHGFHVFHLCINLPLISMHWLV